MQQFQFMLLWTMLRFNCILIHCVLVSPIVHIHQYLSNAGMHLHALLLKRPKKHLSQFALRRTHVDGWTNSVHIKSLLLRTDSAAALAVPRSLSSSAIWIALIKLQWQVHMHMLPHRLLCIIMDALHRREVQSFNKHIWRRGTRDNSWMSKYHDRVTCVHIGK